MEVAAWAPHLEAPEETRRTVVWRTVALQALGLTCRTEVSCSSSPWAVQAASFLRDLYFNRSYGQPRFRTSQATYLTGTLTMHAHQHCRQQTPQCVGFTAPSTSSSSSSSSSSSRGWPSICALVVAPPSRGSVPYDAYGEWGRAVVRAGLRACERGVRVLRVAGDCAVHRVDQPEILRRNKLV